MLKENFYSTNIFPILEESESEIKKKSPSQSSSKAYVNAMRALQERIKNLEANSKSKEELIEKYKNEMVNNSETMSKYEQILKENLEQKQNLILLEKKLNDANSENSGLKINLNRTNIDNQENKEELERFSKKNRELKNELERCKLEIATFKTNFNSLNYQINRLTSESNILQNEKTSINVERNSLSIDNTNLKSEKAQLLLDNENLMQENHNLKISIAIIKNTHDLLKKNYDTLKEAFEEKSKIFEKQTEELEILKLDYETQISNLEKNFQKIKEMYNSKTEELLSENFHLKNKLEYTMQNNENYMNDNIYNQETDRNLSPLPMNGSERRENFSASMRQEFAEFFEKNIRSNRKNEILKRPSNSELRRYDLNEVTTPDFFQNKTFHFGKTSRTLGNKKSSLKTDIANLEDKISTMNAEYEELLSKNKQKDFLSQDKAEIRRKLFELNENIKQATEMLFNQNKDRFEPSSPGQKTLTK